MSDAHPFIGDDTMRVISGIYKSRPLLEVESESTRSTKDRVKEALFNALYPLSQFDEVLDLFAGSGALGIEAYSRGAKHVTFVEHSKEAHKILLKNLRSLNITATVHKQDALTYLKTLTQSFDLMLLDPPYKQGLLNESLKWIDSKKLLQARGLMVLLSHKSESLIIPESFHVIKSKDYGITNVKILEWSSL